MRRAQAGHDDRWRGRKIWRTATAYRQSICAIVLVALSAGCAVVAPAPTPPQPDFRVLVDIGIFGGPPELPPPYHIVGLGDDTLLVVTDRGASQSLREVRWNGKRWEVIAGLNARLLPVEEDGPYLRTVTVGTDAGFSTEAVLLLARVPKGPISRVEIEVDGVVEDIPIHQHPVSATVFPSGTEIGDEFTAFDLRTFELDRGVVHHD